MVLAVGLKYNWLCWLHLSLIPWSLPAAAIQNVQTFLYVQNSGANNWTVAASIKLNVNPAGFLGGSCHACLDSAQTRARVVAGRCAAHQWNNGNIPCFPLHMIAATVFPTIPAVVIETLGIVFGGGGAGIVGFDFFAGKPYGWWGASLVLNTGVGISALLSLFSLISSESGFPARGSFTPRFSLAGKLSGSGLPVAVGEPLFTCLGLTVCWGWRGLEAGACLPGFCSHHANHTASLIVARTLLRRHRLLLRRVRGQNKVSVLLRKRWRLPFRLQMPGWKRAEESRRHLRLSCLVSPAARTSCKSCVPVEVHRYPTVR